MASVESIERVRQSRAERTNQREDNALRQAEQSNAMAMSNSAAAIDINLREIQRRANSAHQADLNDQEMAEHLGALHDENTQFRDVNATTLVHYLIWLIAIPTVYGIDCLLFAPTARHLALKQFPNNPRMVTVCIYLIPLFILLIEMGLAVHLISIRETAERKRTRATVGAWTAAILAALSMPALVAASQILAQSSRQTPRQFWMMVFTIVGMVIIALIAHGSILFGGTRARDAKAFLIFKIHELLLRGRRNFYHRQSEREGQAATEVFATYWRNLDTHNNRYPNNRIQAGPFDEVTRTVLNKRYGYAIIEAPHTGQPNSDDPDDDNSNPHPPDRNSPSGGATPVVPAPISNNPVSDDRQAPQTHITSATNHTAEDSPIDGENAYLRRTLEAIKRNADDEVRP